MKISRKIFFVDYFFPGGFLQTEQVKKNIFIQKKKMIVKQ